MTDFLNCSCGNIIFAKEGISGKRQCYRCRRSVDVRFADNGSCEIQWLSNYVQSCITAIGFPDNLDSLIGMADWHKEEEGRWITDLEFLLCQGNTDNEGRERNYWSGARWMTEGDILFFYQSGFKANMFSRKLLKLARKLPAEEGKPIIELLERNCNLIKRYGGSIFACAEITGPSEYIGREDNEKDDLHFRGRIFVHLSNEHIFEFPLAGEELKRHVRLSTGGTITPLYGEDFEGVKRALAERNDLPQYLLNSKPGGWSFSNVSKKTWREISCSWHQRFVDESQLRVYLLDYLLDEIKDPGTPLLQECECFRDGKKTGRVDYFIQIDNQWVAVEAKLNVLCERDLLGQISRYTNISFFQPDKGRHRGRRFESSSSAVCLVADQWGIYLIDEGHFILGEPGSPAWRRERLTQDEMTDIREAIISKLAFRREPVATSSCPGLLERGPAA